jgi:hypothetical protein
MVEKNQKNPVLNLLLRVYIKIYLKKKKKKFLSLPNQDATTKMKILKIKKKHKLTSSD